MTRQYFPSIDQIFDLVMMELPGGLYAEDRADNPDLTKRSYSSSEIRAHAQVLANLYSNLKLINDDKYIVTVTQDGLTRWEKELFSNAQDSMLTYLERQQRAFAKIRAQGGINLPAISEIVHGILDPIGLAFDILPYCGQFNGSLYGAWILDYSSLDIDTFLGTLDPIWGVRGGFAPLDCDRNYMAAGLTLAEMNEIELTAYTYELRIYGNADATTLMLLDQALTSFEPARSDHVILNNSVPGPI